MYKGASQSCPAYSGGYTSQSPNQGGSPQAFGVYLDSLPSHLIPCNGTVYAWHYCYYSTGTNESRSDAVFAVYHTDAMSEGYLLREGSHYPFFLSSRESVFSCGTVNLNESEYFSVFAGNIVGVCLGEAASGQSPQLDMVTSNARGSAAHWRTTSGLCSLYDIAQSVEDYQQNMPFSLHLFVDISKCSCVVALKDSAI